MSIVQGKISLMGAGRVAFECPGCGYLHSLNVDRGNAGPCWGYNGDPHRPTFTPSVLVKGVQRLTDAELAAVLRGETVATRPFVCHSFVTDGRIEFLPDCTHSLAGQTVDLPDMVED